MKYNPTVRCNRLCIYLSTQTNKEPFLKTARMLLCAFTRAWREQVPTIYQKLTFCTHLYARCLALTATRCSYLLLFVNWRPWHVEDARKHAITSTSVCQEIIDNFEFLPLNSVSKITIQRYFNEFSNAVINRDYLKEDTIYSNDLM